MRSLTLRQTDPDSAADPVESPPARPDLPPLLVDLRGLSALLCRSEASLQRDDAAGRLPVALRIGGSKRWRYLEITAWVEAGCPPRAEWAARRRDQQ
jgi:hypothetical protein